MQIHVVDDEACWRTALTQGLRALGHPVRAHASGEALLNALSTTLPNCILLDWHLGTERGIDVLSRLAGRREDCVVVVMSGDDEADKVVAAMRAGAKDFVVKDCGLDVLTRRVAAAGEQFTRAAPASIERERAQSATAQLSQRERDVLARVADGVGTKTIAHELGLSPRTVEMHRIRLRERLGVGSMHEAVGLWRLAQL